MCELLKQDHMGHEVGKTQCCGKCIYSYLPLIWDQNPFLWIHFCAIPSFLFSCGIVFREIPWWIAFVKQPSHNPFVHCLLGMASVQMLSWISLDKSSHGMA